MTVLVVTLRSPAIPVAAVGVGVVLFRSLRRPGNGTSPDAALRILGLPVLVGLFGLAVALGTLGRTWSGPATLLAHLDLWGTAAVAAFLSVLVNNLPAASLLAARQPPHPFASAGGAQRGPEPVRHRVARLGPVAPCGEDGRRATASIARASVLGLVSVPLAIAAAVGVLTLSGT